MHPLAVILLGFAAGAMGRWLFGAQGDKEKKKNASPPPEWPMDLPKVSAKGYLFKWLHCLFERLRPTVHKPMLPAPVASSTKRPLSLRVMCVLNWLDKPLYWSGIAFAIWMMVDAVLSWLLTSEMLAQYSLVAAPVIAVLSPATVGYWTNYLAIKMLFHPRRRNALWWGLIPARRDELVESISQGILDRLISPKIVSKYLSESALIKNLVDHSVGSIQSVVNDPEFRRETKGLIYGFIHDLVTSPETRKTVSKWVGKKIDEWTGHTWSEKIFSLFKSIWGPKVRQQVLKALPEITNALEGVFNHVDRLLDKIPTFIEKEGGKIEAGLTTLIVEGLRSLDLKGIISAQLNRMDESELEEMLTGPVSSELKFIMTSGGIFGILVGLSITWPWVRGILVLMGLMFTFIYFYTVQPEKEDGQDAGNIKSAIVPDT